MKGKKILKWTVITLSAGFLFLQSPVTGQAASTVNTESISEKTDYDSAFRIGRDSIVNIENNAGNYRQSVIENAVDQDSATHWETNRPNKDNFHNMITVTFDQTYEISRLHYLVRQDGGKPKGFPLEYNIYYSTSESGEDFQLLKHGTYDSVTASEIEITVDPTQMRRVRFEFVKAYNNWASAAELSFYRYDDLADKMKAVFTDRTYSALNDEYKDQSKLDELRALAEKSPARDKYIELLDIASGLIENPDMFEERVFTASQRGNYSKEKSRTQISWLMYSFDSTGYYVTPGETIQVYVEADDDAVMPQLVLGQVGKGKGDWRRWFNLKPGINTITAQTGDKMNPAAIYISNQALPEDQAYAPKIRIVGGTKFPCYVHGKTDPVAFEEELREYVKNVSYDDEDFENGNPNGYYYNIAEVTSQNCTITTSAAGCLKGITQVPGKTIADSMNVWEDMYYSYAKYSGYDTEDESSDNYMPRGKFMCRVFSKGPFGWADVGYTGYNGGGSPKRDGGFYVSLVSPKSIVSGGWAIFHELGHAYDGRPLGISECTNNLYALMMQDKYVDENRLKKANIWEKTILPFINDRENITVSGTNSWNYLAAINQLEMIYGRNTFYGQAQAVMRQDVDGQFQGLTKYEKMAVAMSLAAQKDLTYHFEFYDIPIGEKAKSLVAHLEKGDKKTYYANEKCGAKDATAFENPDSQPEIAVSGSGTVNLQITMDEKDAAILCYEVYRDGEFLGITYDGNYEDTKAEPNQDHTYTAIAYDRKLNPSKTSEPVVKNPSEPSIIFAENTIASLYQDFDPMKGVIGKNADGEDLTESVKVVENTVDTSKKGDYYVTYEVQDAVGNHTTKTRKVHVAAQTAYLSDLNWTSVKIGYGTTGKDKSVSKKDISLLMPEGELTFAKGIGTHAPSEIVYDISKSQADRFESYIGVDGNMRDSKASSVTFEVYVDGEKKYDSGLMTSSEEARFVSVDVTGASELKLVVTNGGNGNGSDHADWADAKLIVENGVPQISNIGGLACMPGETLDLWEGVTAEDIEDGDLTGQIMMDTDFDGDKAGIYRAVYTVTDAEGNTTTAERIIAVVNTFTYASDEDWASASCGWGSIKKDLSISGGTLQLNEGDDTWGAYEKGIGTHAYSQITYDLKDKDYQAFSSYVGIDGAMRKSGVSSVIFEVYTDGVKVFDSGLMKANSPKQYVFVPLQGVSELKLVVTNGGNGSGSDHADWADAKFHYYLNKSGLEQMIQDVKETDKEVYTEESLARLEESLQAAEKVLKASGITQKQMDDAAADLQAAIDQLKAKTDKQALSQVLEFADAITDLSYVDPSLTHREIRYENLVIYRTEARELLEKTDVAQEELDQAAAALQYMIEETGQKYVAGTLPQVFEAL